MRRLATGGMLWVSLGTVVGKIASLAAQLVLGWILDSHDFALYAIAISWSTMVLALRNAGTQRLLIQKGSRYDDFAGVCLKVALLFNGLGCVVLAATAPALSQIYESRSLLPLMWVIAVSLPIGTAAMVFQAKLSSDLNFATLARINIWSSLLRHASMVSFALLGFGAVSFVLPLIVVALFETAAGWHTVGRWPATRPLTWSAMQDVLRDSRWIMLTSFAGILVLNGDYLAISLLQPKEVLGVYYFGFQLSFSLAVLFTNGLESVMMPAFAMLEHDPSLQRHAFFKAVRVLVFGTTLACFGLLQGADALVHELWGGKWDGAIPVIQLLALSLPIKMIVPLSRSLLEAGGAWQFVAGLLLLDGIGTIAAGAAGAWIGGVTAIAAALSAYNLVAGLALCGCVSIRIGGNLHDIVGPVISTFGIGMLAWIVASGVSSTLRPDGSGTWQILGQIVLYAVCYLALTTLLRRDSMTEIVGLLRWRVSAWNLERRAV